MIKQKRINNINKYLVNFNEHDALRIGIPVQNVNKDIMQKLGFKFPLLEGISILPIQNIGPISHYNAEGKYIKDKSKSKETAYRQTEWTWKQWVGRHKTITRTEVRDVPYKRYPRTYLIPPSIYLTIGRDNNNNLSILSPIIDTETNTLNEIKHIANLFLEIFGEFVFYDKANKAVINAPIKRLSWEILPKGKRPWSQLVKDIRPIVDQAKKGNIPVIWDRLKTINNNNPNFVAVGSAGFNGYLVFGFTNKDIFILESIYPDNATYVFDSKWGKLSQLTKAEILTGNLQKERLIHRKGWRVKLNKILRKH